MFQFPDADFERSFYRDLFGIEPLGGEPRRDLDWAVDLSSGTSQDPGDQNIREPVTAGVVDS